MPASLSILNGGPFCCARAADVAPAAEHADAAAERLELVGVLARDERHVRDDPAQLRDAGCGQRRVDLLPAVDDHLIVGRRERVVLVAPTGFGDELRAVLPRGRRGADDRAVARGELADADGLQHVGAELREHVREPRLQVRRVHVGFHRQEIDAVTVDQPALVKEREQRVVHVVFVGVRGAVGVVARGRERAFVEVRRDADAAA